MAIIFDERGLPITSTNPFPVSVTSSNSVLVDTETGTVLDGQTLSAEGDVTGYVAKRVEVDSAREGWVGLETSADEGATWRSLVRGRDTKLRDEFTGDDEDPLGSDWLVTKHNSYTGATTFGRIDSNKAQLQVVSSSSYSQVALTLSGVPLGVTVDTVVEVEIDETTFVGTLRDMRVGLLPTLPATDGTRPQDITNWKQLFQVYNGTVVLSGVTAYTIPALSASAKYVVVFNATSIRIYREGVQIYDAATTLDQATYYLAHQLATNTTGSPFTVNLDNYEVWQADASARVRAYQPYSLTVTDPVVGLLRATLQNGFEGDAEATVSIYGQP